MNTKLILGTAGVVLSLAGLAATFAPHELLAALGVVPTPLLAVVMQLLGALWFAFGMVDWFARGSLIGGIYNRPVAIGNFAHFLIGGLALVKFVIAGARQPAVLVATIVYVVFAILFTLIFYRSPVQPQ